MNPSSDPDPKVYSTPGSAQQTPPYSYYPPAMPHRYPDFVAAQNVVFVASDRSPPAANHCSPPRFKRASSCDSDTSFVDKCQGPQAEFKCAFCKEIFMHRMKRGHVKCAHCRKTNTYGNSRVKGFFCLILAVIELVMAAAVVILTPDIDGKLKPFVWGFLPFAALLFLIQSGRYFCSRKAQLISTPEALGYTTRKDHSVEFYCAEMFCSFCCAP